MKGENKKNYNLINGDSAEVLKNYPDNYFDSVVTDPPYGIEFLGKEWDTHTGTVELWKEVFRVLKPGGHLLAFSAARTYHRLATNLEDVGFEIRDQLMWIYSSGFPKAQDVGKQIQKKMGVKKTRTVIQPRNEGMGTCYNDRAYNKDDRPEGDQVIIRETAVITDPEAQQWAGWKTALKPAHEPIAMARKPMKQSTVKNVQEHGTGALNIDATRIPFDDTDKLDEWTIPTKEWSFAPDTMQSGRMSPLSDQGRYPSNVIGEIEGYSKYFYSPKVSRKERHVGLDAPAPIPNYTQGEVKNHPLWDPSIGTNVQRLKHKIMEHNADLDKKSTSLPKRICSEDPLTRATQADHASKSPRGNNHPTVKPVALMAYLVRLVTPPNGHVLDPFNGSGSTGMAAIQEGMQYTGIDLDPKYIEIAERRIEAWSQMDHEKPKKLKQGKTGPEDGIKIMTFNQSEPAKYRDRPNKQLKKAANGLPPELFE